MPLSFPSSPSVNDTYTFNNSTWLWDGISWRSAGTSGSGGGSSNVDLSSITSNIVPDSDEARDLGSPSLKFRHLYLSGNTLFLGNANLKSEVVSKLRVDEQGTLELTGTVKLPPTTQVGTRTLTVSGVGNIDGGTANGNYAGVAPLDGGSA